MEDKVLILVEKLSEKLGVSAEYIFSVLVKQAPFSAIVPSIALLFIVIIGIVLLKLHLKFGKKDESGRSLYYKKEEIYIIPMIIATIIWCVLLFVSLIQLFENIYGFINPEYWALSNIVSMIK